MTVFDAQTVSLIDLNIIEASAGTGKTYTLAELYLRLIVEKELTVDQILVVTFTNAATEELRDRLRQKLVDARDDEKCHQHDRKKLNLAIQSFDEAAIFTIHGFCQRVLGDYAFESGLHFELELIGDDNELLQSVADDFWRKHVTTADKDFVACLIAKKENVESLLASVRSYISKPYLNILSIPEIDIKQIIDLAQNQFDRVKKAWLKDKDTIIATLQNKTLLNGNKYRKSSVEKWLLLMAELCEYETLPTSLFKDFDRFTPAQLEDALKKDQQLPDLNFWLECELLLEQFNQLQQAREVQLQSLRLQLLNYLRETVPQRKQQQGVQSYDDLLLNLEQALNGRRGDWLVKQLREKYRAALIDEFQDTDPIQYASFSRIFADSGLPTFLVGDPKQAIYSFRGADIFTYLKAKSAAQYEHTLGTNWRSHPDLVSAVNTLFSRQPFAFIFENIPFHPIDAQRSNQTILKIDNDRSSALNIIWSASEKAMSKGDLTTISANTTANEIAKLLNLAQADKATLLDEKAKSASPVTGGDIAVLVRNHRQAQAIQDCLRKRGVNSVQQGRESVFLSAQAQMLQRVLSAIAEPSNESRIKAALTTDLWGVNATELYQLQQDEEKWLNQLNVFYDLHQIWIHHGFKRLFRHLLIVDGAEQRLLALPDGERQLTNLLHLAELVQEYCNSHGEGIEAVLHWLSSHRQSVDNADDVAQLRLESDEHLVKIITIHKSKGLEYPIVFCPFLWDASLRAANNKVISFHQAENDNQASVAFSEPALSQATELATLEEYAEELRLFYVALTRARERCVIVWGNVRNVTESALYRFLHPDLEEAESTPMQAELMALAESSEGAISIEYSDEIDREIHLASKNPTQSLSAKEFTGSIHQPWRIGSFSALTQGHDAELPDYDENELTNTTADVRADVLDRFNFPRGAQAGTCLHAIFEHWDFSSQDDAGLQLLVSRLLLQYGFEEKWCEVVCQWLKEVVITPLSSDLTLASLTSDKRLDELAFYFPVAKLSVTSLQKTLLPLLDKDSALATVIKRLSFYSLTGFMKGFIDLIFEHNGKYYVVDYKSNYLGNSSADYRTESLTDAMIAHDYPLQYLIYSLALHRYLKLRIADYSPEKYLGGVYYLFIRGMHPNWKQAGIFYDKLDSDLLEQFDRYLQGEQG